MCLLYLIEILHQTTTAPRTIFICRRLYLIEILHQTTTDPVDRSNLCKLYLIEILHQTTTRESVECERARLYLIEILHQTTTGGCRPPRRRRCILSKFYIKPQLSHWRAMSQGVVSYRNSTSNHNWKSSIVFSSLLYLIEILHQTTTCQEQHKEQQALYLIEILHQTTTRPSTFRLTQTLYLIEILHQTTTLPSIVVCCRRCILSKFYIKPQLSGPNRMKILVVSYRNSTSNHNLASVVLTVTGLYLIEILHQTTTTTSCWWAPTWLYLIEILHQTTTWSKKFRTLFSCILSKFYIKPQQNAMLRKRLRSCILSKFYIKPQPFLHGGFRAGVVSYRNSTSNHNDTVYTATFVEVVSYRNSTSNHNCLRWSKTDCIVVSYRNSTSNHNLTLIWWCCMKLYLIEILHQTTTAHLGNGVCFLLYLIEILHQTTTGSLRLIRLMCCILSKFYIKPQLAGISPNAVFVVSYRNSTSNHNYINPLSWQYLVVSYRNSTSNHNVGPHIDW